MHRRYARPWTSLACRVPAKETRLVPHPSLPQFLLARRYGVSLSRRTWCRHPSTLAVSARSVSRPAFESFAESSFGFVADSTCDFAEAFRARSQHPGRLVHSPAGQVLHGWLADQFPEPGSETGPRHSHMQSQRGNRPGLLGSVVNQRQGLSNLRIGHCPYQSLLALASTADVSAHRLNEDNVGQMTNDRFGSRQRRGGLAGQILQGRLQPGNGSSLLSFDNSKQPQTRVVRAPPPP